MEAIKMWSHLRGVLGSVEKAPGTKRTLITQSFELFCWGRRGSLRKRSSDFQDFACGNESGLITATPGEVTNMGPRGERSSHFFN